jgi:hypothetical protein
MVVTSTSEGAMDRKDLPGGSEDDHHPDPPTIRWTDADLENSPEYVQTTSEVASAIRGDALAKVARRAAHRRGEFRWYEFRARRRYARSR